MSAAPEIRRAEGPDRERASRLVFESPGPEAAALAGDGAVARRLGLALLEAGLHPDPGQEAWAAWDGPRPVGVLLLTERAPTRRPAQLVDLLRAVARAVPLVRLPGFLRRSALRARLDFPIPEGSLHVMELHVAPDWRGRGVGAALLGKAESVARQRGLASLSLTTHMGNPARRLYERSGYRVIAERRVHGYEALTGAPGRVLMEKRLGAPIEA